MPDSEGDDSDMMSTSTTQGTETTGFSQSPSPAMTQEEMQRERQVSLESYIDWTVKLKKLQANEEIKMISVKKSKQEKLKAEVLQDVKNAEQNLADASSKVCDELSAQEAGLSQEMQS